MRRRRVVFAPQARLDLLAIGDFIADRAGRDGARSYIERIEAYCLGLEIASEREEIRSHIWPGLRVIGFERRVAVAFTVTEDVVTILRLRSGGFDWPKDFPIE